MPRWRWFLAGIAFVSAQTLVWTSDLLPPPDPIIGNSLQAHITFLADDLLEGRAPSTPGYDIAARYVAAQFRQWGLAPAGSSNDWFQPVPLLESRLLTESTRLELRHADQSTSLNYNEDFISRPAFVQNVSSISAPLVLAGFGVHAPELGYDDFAQVDLKGKIAVILSGAPPKFPTTARAHYSSAREKAIQLAARGAVGTIAVTTPKDLEEFPWPRQVNQARFPNMRWIGDDGTPVDVFPQLKASMSVSPRGVGKLFAHSPKTPPEIFAAAADSQSQTFPLNVEATLTTTSQMQPLSSPNVLGILPGRDPQLRSQSVLVTAHLDHMGRGPAFDGDAIYNGAYDNAIGVAILLESARLLASTPDGLRRSVLFAAVTAEEKGLLGSDYLARHLPPQAGEVIANINLDMVLLLAPTRNLSVPGVEHSTLREPVEAAAGRLGLALLPDPKPDRVIFIRSDQYSFVRVGIPAMFPIALDDTNAPAGPPVMTAQTFLKDHYHRPSDDVRLPRDTVSSVRFVQFVTEVARQVANNPKPPRWHQGDFFGELYGKGR